MQTVRGSSPQLSTRMAPDGGVRAMLPAPPAIRSLSAAPPFSPARPRHLAPGLAGTQTLEPAVVPRWHVLGTQAPEALSPRSAVAVAQAQLAAEDSETWKDGGFPAYLQSQLDDFCAAWDDALAEQELPSTSASQPDPVWKAIKMEAEAEAKSEPLLSSFLHASIVSHDSFSRSLAFVLANRLEDTTLHSAELSEIFHTALRENPSIKQAALADIVAFKERDPACVTYSAALLYYKGFHAIQAHRIAHVLWNSGRKMLALALQSRVSEVLAIDIHPGARIGKGVLMDHGTGVVIGETAVVENNVSIMQNVTLGGTGKNAGDRHPKVEGQVLIGAGTTVLGNITIGRGAQVAANSLVLKPVPPKTMVAGSPAREVGKVTGIPALRMQHWLKSPPMEESEGSIRAELARKPDPFSGANTSSASRPASLSQHSPATAGGSSVTAAADEDCGQRGGESAADWVLGALSKSQNGASQEAPHSVGAGAGSRPSSNGTAGPASWLSGSDRRPAGGHVIDLDAVAGRRQSTPAQDPEPWVHNGAAGSGAEALARATLRSASAGLDVPPAAPATGLEGRDAHHQARLWSHPLAGHTDDEASSEEEGSSEPWRSSDADTSSSLSSEAAQSCEAAEPRKGPRDVHRDFASQRKADGSADYII